MSILDFKINNKQIKGKMNMSGKLKITIINRTKLSIMISMKNSLN